MKVNKVKRRLEEGGVTIGTMMMEFSTTGIARIAARGGGRVRRLRHGAHRLEHGNHPDAHGDFAGPPTSCPWCACRPCNITSSPACSTWVPWGSSFRWSPTRSRPARSSASAISPRWPARRGLRSRARRLPRRQPRHQDETSQRRSARNRANRDCACRRACRQDRRRRRHRCDLDRPVRPHNFARRSRQLRPPVLRQATHRVLDACQSHNKMAVLGAMDPAVLGQGPAQGYRMLVYLADLWIYQQALRQGSDQNQARRGAQGDHH